MSADTTPLPAEGEGLKSRAAPVLILATATLTTALVSMALLVVSVVLPQLQGSLSATPDQVSWTVTLNLVASAIGTPPSGWLANRFGRRNVLLWCTVGFTVSTFLCSTAQSLELLVVYRVLQGAFGAPLNPLCNAAVLDAYPREKHAYATAIFGMGVMIGPMLGPAVGGVIAEFAGWRAAFVAMGLVSMVALTGIWLFMHDDRRQETRLDWVGFFTLSVALLCLQLVLDRGQRLDWYDSTMIVGATGLGVAALWVCLIHCYTARRPFISPAMLMDRNYFIGLVCTFAFGCLSYSPMVLLPPMLHDIAGYPDQLIGIVLSSRGVGAFLGFFLSIGIGKLDPRIGLTLGFVTFMASGLLMMDFDMNVRVSDLVITSMMQGASAGFCWVPLMVIAFGTLDRRWLNEAVALLHLGRYLGTSIFVSIAVTLTLRSGSSNRERMTEFVSPFNELLGYDRLVGSWSTDTLPELTALGAEIDRQATMIGYLNAFGVYAVLAAGVLLLILLVRVPKKEPAKPAD